VRIVVCSLIAIPLLFADAVLVFTLPAHLTGRLTIVQMAILGAGVLAYLGLHFLVRKPERLYLWGHELTHLLVAKAFLRQVHGFHITSRSGGKVVIDRTNVAIDLAPYAVPFYSVVAMVPVLALRGQYRYAETVYLAAAAFFFTMHLCFSVEGFVDKQPDLLRSGRLFSAGIVALFLLLWLPLLGAPSTPGGLSELGSSYRDWLGRGWMEGRHFLTAMRARIAY
jgi:hypothetical protein